MKRGVALMMTGLLGACASVAPIPSDVFLRPALPRAAQPLAEPLTAGELYVDQWLASGVHQERAVILTEDGGRSLRQAQYQFWLDPPPQIVREAISACLRSANAAPVITSERRRVPALEIDGRILRFEQMQGAPSALAVIELEVQMRARRRLLLEKTYAAQEAIANNSPTAVADAMSGALSAVCAELITDARTLPPLLTGNVSP